MLLLVSKHQEMWYGVVSIVQYCLHIHNIGALCIIGNVVYPFPLSLICP